MVDCTKIFMSEPSSISLHWQKVCCGFSTPSLLGPVLCFGIIVHKLCGVLVLANTNTVDLSTFYDQPSINILQFKDTIDDGCQGRRFRQRMCPHNNLLCRLVRGKTKLQIVARPSYTGLTRHDARSILSDNATQFQSFFSWGNVAWQKQFTSTCNAL